MEQEYRVREYPLEVERTVEGETYYSKGWHDAEAMAGAANAYIDDETGDDSDQRFVAADVRYDVWRCIPADPYEGVYMWFIPGQLGTRGAFPVTLLYN